MLDQIELRAVESVAPLRPRKLSLLFLMLAMWNITSLSGCGSAEPTLVPVSGKVTGPDGKPLANITVQFVPENTSGRPIGAAGVTDANGQYSLISDRGQPGAIPGSYRVVLFDNATEEDDQQLGKGRPPTPSRIPHRYGASTTTPLTATVESGPKTYDWKVEPR
jgi:predicted small lipoprotein YifL